MANKKKERVEKEKVEKIKRAQDKKLKVEGRKYSKDQLRATFTGKAIKDGGSEGREEATGLGGVFVLQEMLKK